MVVGLTVECVEEFHVIERASHVKEDLELSITLLTKVNHDWLLSLADERSQFLQTIDQR